MFADVGTRGFGLVRVAGAAQTSESVPLGRGAMAAVLLVVDPAAPTK